MDTLHQISIARGGVPKQPIESGFVDRLGIIGDAHRSKDHGGPDRAVCLFSLDLIQQLHAEGHPIQPGSIGENLTVSGLDWREMSPGTRVFVGDEVLLEITSYTTPCVTIQDSFRDRKIARVSQKVRPGQSRVYARVLETGRIRTGDEVRVVSSLPVASLSGEEP